MSPTFVFVCVRLFVFTYLTTAGITEGTSCGPARLTGSLDETGQCLTAVTLVETNLSSTIMIKCRLNGTMNIAYNPRLKIYYTISGREPVILRENYTVTKSDDVMDYVFNISVDAELDRSIIMCGAGYQPVQGLPPAYCYTDSVALVIIQDHNPCKTQDNDSFLSTGEPLSTSESQTTLSTRPMKSTTTQTADYMAPTTRIPTTLPPSADADPNVAAVNRDVLFPVIGVAIFVGILLVLANALQLWVIVRLVKNQKRTARDRVSATDPTKQEGNDNARDESEELSTTFENGSAQESGDDH